MSDRILPRSPLALVGDRAGGETCIAVDEARSSGLRASNWLCLVILGGEGKTAIELAPVERFDFGSQHTAIGWMIGNGVNGVSSLPKGGCDGQRLDRFTS